MSNRELIAGFLAFVIAIVSAFLLAQSGYGFVCGVIIFLLLAPLPVCLVTDEHVVGWGIATNVMMMVFTIGLATYNNYASHINMPMVFVVGFLAVGVPLGAVISLAISIPTKNTRRRKLESIRRSGLCEQCGYDLRASEHRCPECGRPFSKWPPPWNWDRSEI